MPSPTFRIPGLRRGKLCGVTGGSLEGRVPGLRRGKR